MSINQAVVEDAFRKAAMTNYLEVFHRISALIEKQDNTVVAIDGNCGSGKSTLAAAIEDLYDCNVFHMDHFFLTFDLRTKTRLKEIGGNVDYVRFREEVIAGINSGCEFSYRIYDCRKMNMSEPRMVSPKRLSIVEGAYSMHPALIESYDLKVFLKMGAEEQKERIRNRNGEEALKQFLTKWIPMENAYFEKMRIEEKSDLVFNVNHFFPKPA